MPVGVPSLTPEQSRLASEFFPYALKLAAKWSASRPDLEVEIVSAASLGLVEAARLFDAEHPPSPFRVFASVRIRSAIKDCLEGEASRPRLSPLDAATPSARIAFSDEAIRDFGRLISPLPSKQRMVLRSIYLDGRTSKEIARISGFTALSIARTHRIALITLRRLIEAPTIP